MSFEGYYQVITNKGHYFCIDAMEVAHSGGITAIEDEFHKGEKVAWWNLVDQTNGSYDYANIPIEDYGRILEAARRGVPTNEIAKAYNFREDGVKEIIRVGELGFPKSHMMKQLAQEMGIPLIELKMVPAGVTLQVEIQIDGEVKLEINKPAVVKECPCCGHKKEVEEETYIIPELGIGHHVVQV